MDKKRFLILGPYLLVLIFLAGCATTYQGPSYGKNTSGEASLNVASVLKFDDIPVPYGFKPLDKQSFAFQNDATRVALLKYEGVGLADQVVAFYKAQMPSYNWNPINIIEYERRIMNYEKKSESCIITIESKGRKSIVTIAISPKSRPMKVEIRK